jgi:riboflavin biosynthesis pyrimidine reductase
MQRLLPTPSADVDLLDAYAWPDDGGTFVRANMVSSVDGGATVNGLTGGLSSKSDKEIFNILRGRADAVVIGAGTARAEGYQTLPVQPEFADARAAAGQPAAPVLVLVSRRLALDVDSPLFAGGAERTVVVTCESSDEQQRERLAQVADLVVTGGDSVDISGALEQLAARGLTRVLCEGGPHLLTDVVAAGRLDELCLTIAPRLVGGEALRILSGSTVAVGLTLTQLLEDEGELFTRYEAP